jgi:minor curlin subunit
MKRLRHFPTRTLAVTIAASSSLLFSSAASDLGAPEISSQNPIFSAAGPEMGGGGASRMASAPAAGQLQIRLVQTGSANVSEIQQSGASNQTYVYQNGRSNAALVIQSGSNNSASVDQQGTLNTARIEQYGQYGRAAITQFGSSSRATVIQY